MTFCNISLSSSSSAKSLLQFNKGLTPQSPIDMILTDNKDSAAYKEMRGRYIELKVILTAFGINLAELDVIKE